MNYLFRWWFINYSLSMNSFQGIKMVNIQTYDVRYTETMGKGTFEVQVNIILTNTVNFKIISVKFYCILMQVALRFYLIRQTTLMMGCRTACS